MANMFRLDDIVPGQIWCVFLKKYYWLQITWLLFQNIINVMQIHTKLYEFLSKYA